MRTIIIIIIALVGAAGIASAQCNQSSSRFYIAKPPTVVAGQILTLLPRDGEKFPQVVPARRKAIFDGVEIPILNASADVIMLRIPSDASERDHDLAICILDGPYGLANVPVRAHRDTLDTLVDGSDPDPRTQKGPKQDLSDAGRRGGSTGRNSHPNGGHGGTLPCPERHVIDGAFSILADGTTREWSGIAPLIGRFSHLYLDYCAKTSVMYLCNDWILGRGQYDRSTCYNLFEFTTGNGRERWKIKVTHDTARPVIVVLNGTDVTDDTTIVMGGGYGYGPSPSDTVPHTIYEFGVRVSAGLFMIPNGSDPVEYRPSTNATLVCDQQGEGYGLIQEPTIRAAVFSDRGVETEQYVRYIPIGGVVGLEVEPNDIAGELHGDTATYRGGAGPSITNVCTGVGVVDGQISPGEWDGTRPANGRFSDLYAQYCGGTLHILNDWVHATSMPNNATCFNLFELFTGNGREHWGIWVWQDPTRRPTVKRNGVDVSDDTTIVHAGVAGWGSSPRMAEPHAFYEFRISTMEGGFAMQFADPGPSSYCSLNTSSTDEQPRPDDSIELSPQPYRLGSGPLTLKHAPAGTLIDIVDLTGRTIHGSRVTGDAHAIDLGTAVAPGMYVVRLRSADGHVQRQLALPLLIIR